VHVGRGEHHVDHRVGRGEEAFDVRVAEFVDHPLDFQLAGRIHRGADATPLALLLLGGLGVVGQGADGFGDGAVVDRLREATSARGCGHPPADPDDTDGAEPRSGGSRTLIAVAASRLCDL
jgi:hypothetical protein